MRVLTTLVTILIFSFIPQTISAHPHMYLETKCEFNFKNSTLQGFWTEFHFDQYFTENMLMTFDENSDSEFSIKETKNVYNEAFDNLKNYGYFISIREGKKRSSPQKVSDFSVRLEDNTLIYRFYIDLRRKQTDDLYISFYDPTYYCAVKYSNNPVTFSGSNKLKPQYEIVENKSYPVYYNPVAPATDNTAYEEWEPGLKTYYPEEIHLDY